MSASAELLVNTQYQYFLNFRVIGPLLFLLYINDVVEIFGHGLSTKLYADDVKIYTELGNASDSSNYYSKA